MARTPDFYRILGVSPSATPDEIRSAYRRAAQKWHPDRNRDVDAAGMMRLVNRARDVLLNTEARQEYDRGDYRSGGQAGEPSGSGSSQPNDWEAAAEQAWARYESRQKAESGREGAASRRPGEFLYDRDDADRGPNSVSRTWQRLVAYKYVIAAAAIVLTATTWLSTSGLDIPGISALPVPEPTLVPRSNTPTPVPRVATVTPGPTVAPTAGTSVEATAAAAAAVTGLASPTVEILPEPDEGLVAMSVLRPVQGCFAHGEQVSYRYVLENPGSEALVFDAGGSAGTLFPDYISVEAWIQRTGADDSIVAVFAQRPFTKKLDDGRYEAGMSGLNVSSFLVTSEIGASTWEAGTSYERPGHLIFDTTDFPAGDYRLSLALLETETSDILDALTADFRIGGC